MGLAEANTKLMRSRGDPQKLRNALREVHLEKVKLTRDKSKQGVSNINEGGKSVVPSHVSTDYKNINGMSNVVIKLATKMARTYGADQEELESEGYVGLTLALNKWDEEEDHTADWATYVTKSVMNTMINFINRNHSRWSGIELRNDIDTTVLDGNSESPVDVILRKEKVEKAESALKKILRNSTERESYIIWNHIISDDPESYRDIAEQFRTTKDSIMRDVNRIRLCMRLEGNA